MTKTTKVLLLVIIVLAIITVGSVLYFNNKPVDDVSTPAQIQINNTKIFTASNGSFSFNYNDAFSVNPGDGVFTTDWELNNLKKNGLLLATVTIPRSYMPQTNFSEAKLTFGKSSDTNAIKNCLVDNSGTKIVGQPATVSGYPFTKFIFSDAGAGNFYDTTSYKGIVGGDCYVVEYTIHSTNIGNYDPSQGITEFDKTKITKDMESVVRSLRFIVASN
jgi:Tfp pilus assembly protein PilW